MEVNEIDDKLRQIYNSIGSSLSYVGVMPVVRAIRVIQGQTTHHVVCSLSDGRIISMAFVPSFSNQVPLSIESITSGLPRFKKGKLSAVVEKEAVEGFFNFHIFSVGTTEVIVREIKNSDGQKLVVACCDRSALFYLEGDQIQMQYLREDCVNQASLLTLPNLDSSTSIDLVAFQNK
jgi:hypothetical protein